MEVFNGRDIIPISHDSAVDCLFFTFNTENPVVNSDKCKQMKPFICEKRKYDNSDLTKNLNICPEGWLYSFTDGKCLLYNSTEVEFETAKIACSGNLAKPKSLITNLALVNATLIELADKKCGINIKCQNMGQCMHSDSSSSCKCSENFLGDFCEVQGLSGTETRQISCPLGTFAPKTCRRQCACFNDVACNETTGYCTNFKCKENYYGSSCNRYFKFPNPWVGVESTDKGFQYTSGEFFNMSSIGFDALQSTSQEVKQCYSLSEEWRNTSTPIWKKWNCTEKKSFICERKPKLG